MKPSAYTGIMTIQPVRHQATSPPTTQFSPKIPAGSVDLVPGCAFVIRQWLMRRVADTIGTAIVEETYETSLPQFQIGAKGTPIKSEENRLFRVGDKDLKTVQVKGRDQVINSWPSVLLDIKVEVQNSLGVPFNSAVVQYLENGHVYETAHSDTKQMPSLGDQPVIAVIGFGAARQYEFSPRSEPSKVAFSTTLAHGDMLVMYARSQQDWLHGIAVDARQKRAHVKTSFRFHVPGHETTTSGLRRISSRIQQQK